MRLPGQLVFALWLDDAAVSAQVLMSRAHAIQDLAQIRWLSKYMVKFATLQGLASTPVLIGVLGASGDMGRPPKGLGRISGSCVDWHDGWYETAILCLAVAITR
jgi:hypothetical protein